MALLEVSQIGKRFGGLQVVKDISLTVNPSEIVGLIGTNGAGKTTCFNMISGFTPWDEGDVRLEDRSLAGLSPHQICRLGLTRTFQQTSLFANLSVLDNIQTAAQRQFAISLWSALLQTPRYRQMRRLLAERGEQLAAKVGLSDWLHETASSLSYGQQRMLAIANALATEPKLLLMDEPAAGLNATETAELTRLVQQLRQEGMTILLVEHNMRLVMELCDRVIVMDHGERVAEGPPEEICRNETVIRLYLGEARRTTHA